MLYAMYSKHGELQKICPGALNVSAQVLQAQNRAGSLHSCAMACRSEVMGATQVKTVLSRGLMYAGRQSDAYA
jgi:hypothetical protein